MPVKMKEIRPEAIQGNIIQMLSADWMLIASGTMDKHNIMTASWGGLGYLWNKKVCFCFIRPERYTYELMESNHFFTINFFDTKYKKALELCGSFSGRETNKAVKAGLTARPAESGAVFIEEAKLILECRKVYFQDIDPTRFLDVDIHNSYSNHDYHRMYVGEIIRCLVK